MLLAPPLNSHKFKTSGEKYDVRPLEYFLAEDNSYVIRVIIESAFQYYIALCSQTGFEYDKKLININNAKAAIYDVSRNGQFFTHISIGDDLKYRAVVIRVG